MNVRNVGHRGVTLLELIIAMAIAAVVMTAVVAAVSAQQQAYYLGQKLRGAQGQGRNAVEYVEQKLNLAGYGVDPSLAFDLHPWYTTGPCPSQMAVAGSCVRDSTSNADELVFYARNPSYWVPADPTIDPAGHAWKIIGVNPTGAAQPTGIIVDARAGDIFRKGQILQAVCPAGASYTYVTVSTTTPVAAAGQVTIPLQPVVLANPFQRQDVASSAGGGACLFAGTARLFQIDRYRFHVRPIQVGANSNGSPMYDPYLVLDMGVDVSGPLGTPDGVVDANDELLVAEGIENLQVSYVLRNGTVVGQTPGTPILFPSNATGLTGVPEEISTTLFPGAVGTGTAYSATTWYGYSMVSPLPAARLSDHQANIVAVRVTVVARSALPDSKDRSAPNLFPFNMNVQPPWITNGLVNGADGYQRVLFDTTVALTNTATRGITFY